MIELEDRLSRYREVLDDAVAERLEGRAEAEPVASSPHAAPTERSAGRWWLMVAAAVVAVVAGFALVAEHEPTSIVPAERPTDVDPPARPTTLSTPEPSTEHAPVDAPGTTTAPSPTAGRAPAGPPIEAIAIGDSVMLGAAAELAEAGFTVDATTSRAFADVVDVAESLAAQGRLGDTVVIHVGTNGPIQPEHLDRVATALSDVPTVVFATISLPASYSYADDNNALIRALPTRWSNVAVLEWDGLVDACPGDCLYDDEIHLRPDGQAYYAGLVTALAGRAE